MAKQTTEDEFNLRRQARRRLIGAIALVLLVVFLLPVIFDSEPAPVPGGNIELRIPDKDNAPEFQPKINLPELDRMASGVAAAVPADVPVAASAPATGLTMTPMPAEKKPAATAPTASKAKPEAKPLPAKPKVESKPVAKTQDVPKSGWVVQVGAFANADTARSLQAKLSQQGYRAYTEKAGDVVRVRVGSFPSLEAAEKTKSKLETQGMQSNVVNLE
ncbi:MAG: SPOR domain-containing protein [Nitrosomonadales bacterium]|nr:SPOR domain-containing protein [Nitrosomonadales bacterium]